MAALAGFLRVWQPARIWTANRCRRRNGSVAERRRTHSPARCSAPGLPWLILSLFVFAWGTPQFRAWLDALWVWKMPVPYLHNLVVLEMPPVVAASHSEAAIYTLNLLSATGTGILLSAIVGGLILGFSPSSCCASTAAPLGSCATP